MAGPALCGLVFITWNFNSQSHGMLHLFSFWLLEMHISFSNVFVHVAVRKPKDESSGFSLCFALLCFCFVLFCFVLFCFSVFHDVDGLDDGSAKALAIKPDDMG